MYLHYNHWRQFTTKTIKTSQRFWGLKLEYWSCLVTKLCEMTYTRTRIMIYMYMYLFVCWHSHRKYRLDNLNISLNFQHDATLCLYILIKQYMTLSKTRQHIVRIYTVLIIQHETITRNCHKISHYTNLYINVCTILQMGVYRNVETFMLR